MELKPCPFCGGEAETWRRGGRHGLFVFVQCGVCNAQTRVKNARATDEFEDDDEFCNQTAVQEVQRLWNMRAPVKS